MTLFAELRQAVRALQRAPSFSAISVMTLALAIGGNTAIYSALRTLVLRPLPFADGDRLVYLWHQNPQMGGFLLPPPVRAIDEWRRAPVFEQIERYTGREVEVTGTGEPTRIPITELEPTTLPMLGIAPILGRSFVQGDFAPTAPPIVLIGHALWQSRFGGDKDVAGRTINLDDVPFVIVGVMPAAFRLPMGSDSLWTPAQKAAAPTSTRNALAKLRRGASVADAQAALNAVAGATNDPALKGWRGAVMSPRHVNGTGIETTLWTLAAAVGLLFVIGCVNVANLMLSRNSDRVREVALRQALGASRMQVVRYLLFECGVLAVVGGGFGLLLAQWLIAGMTWLKPRNLEALDRIAIDPHVIGFAALVSILTAILFGLWPSLRGSALAVQQLVSPGSRTTPASGLRQRQILTAMQIGLALVLLVGAALLARSFARLTAVDPGFDPRGLIAMRLSLPASRYGDPDPEIAAGRRQQFFDRVIEQVRAVPGVSAAAVGSGLPPELGVMLGALEIEGRPPAETARGSVIFSGGSVTPGFFTTLRIPIAEGRAFTESDVHGAEPVTIVGQAVAREYFRGASAIGARLRLDQNADFARVVGIAGDVKTVDLDRDDGRLQVYFPRGQVRPGFGTVIVRTDAATAPIVEMLKASVWSVDPKLPITDVFTAAEARGRGQSHARFNMVLLAAFACCGLGLASIGVYGVMALYVGQRYRELGLRIALGASRIAVTRLVLHQMLTPLAFGLGGGMLVAGLLAQQLTPLLFATPPGDAFAYIAAVTAILGAAVVAAAVPWRRATTIDSALVLRGD